MLAADQPLAVSLLQQSGATITSGSFFLLIDLVAKLRHGPACRRRAWQICFCPLPVCWAADYDSILTCYVGMLRPGQCHAQQSALQQP